MTRRFALTLLLVLATTVACTSKAQNELTLHRELWASHGIVNYRFCLQVVCFCEYTEPVIIKVRGDRVTSVVDKTTGEASFCGTPLAIRYKDVTTIDKLFNVIEYALDRQADVVDVECDEEYGHPAMIYIDSSLPTSDDEATYIVTEFEIME